jgi:hypothetical protein
MQKIIPETKLFRAVRPQMSALLKRRGRWPTTQLWSFFGGSLQGASLLLDYDEKTTKQFYAMEKNIKKIAVFTLRPALKMLSSMMFLVLMSSTSTNTNEGKVGFQSKGD